MVIPTPFNILIPVTKSDTVNIRTDGRLTDAVQVGGAGVVVAVLQNDTTVAITAPAGAILPIAIKRINSGSTTATLCVAMYSE